MIYFTKLRVTRYIRRRTWTEEKRVGEDAGQDKQSRSCDALPRYLPATEENLESRRLIRDSNPKRLPNKKRIALPLHQPVMLLVFNDTLEHYNTNLFFLTSDFPLPSFYPRPTRAILLFLPLTPKVSSFLFFFFFL